MLNGANLQESYNTHRYTGFPLPQEGGGCRYSKQHKKFLLAPQHGHGPHDFQTLKARISRKKNNPIRRNISIGKQRKFGAHSPYPTKLYEFWQNKTKQTCT